MERYIATQFYKADSPESRILGESGLVPSEFVLAADAQRALDVEREKVKRLSTCGTDHSTPWWQVKCEDLEAQLATLQAQLADRDAMILQMGEQAAVLAKENMAVKAQLRQVEADRQTLRQLVAALPVVDGQEVSVWLSPDESGWLVSKRPAFPAGLYWAKFRTQAEADSFRALLAYRATLAAKDAGKEDVSHD